MRYREHRFPCDLPVEVVGPDGQVQACIVTNVSQWGVRLARFDAPQIGDTLRLRLGVGTQPREARVRWSAGAYCGLRFAQPLDARTIALARKSVSHKARIKPPGWNLQLRELR
ncbi:MAG: PilZ domain-containing protein [Rhodobacteraceae bacterium]|jgi:hypothetical protein|nr:PilZ domain-containing protein [Paracoccaceae bacterium]